MSDPKDESPPRKTLLLLQEHLTKSVAALVESYLCSLSSDLSGDLSSDSLNTNSDKISIVAEIGYWEMMDEIIADNVKDKINTLNKLLNGAAAGDSIELVHYLIKLGAISFTSALTNACRGRNILAAELMIQMGASIDEYSAIFGIASRHSPNHVLGVLLTHVEPNQATYENILDGGLTSGNMSVISFAVSNGASLLNSLKFACMSGDLGVIVLASIYDKKYSDGLYGACVGNNAKIVERMLNYVKTITNFEMKCCLRCAIRFSNIDIIKLFDKIKPLDIPWALYVSLHDKSYKFVHYLIEKHGEKVKTILADWCPGCDRIRFGAHEIAMSPSDNKTVTLEELLRSSGE